MDFPIERVFPLSEEDVKQLCAEDWYIEIQVLAILSQVIPNYLKITALTVNSYSPAETLFPLEHDLETIHFEDYKGNCFEFTLWKNNNNTIELLSPPRQIEFETILEPVMKAFDQYYETYMFRYCDGGGHFYVQAQEHGDNWEPTNNRVGDDRPPDTLRYLVASLYTAGLINPKETEDEDSWCDWEHVAVGEWRLNKEVFEEMINGSE